jgi:hypothetical protein
MTVLMMDLVEDGVPAGVVSLGVAFVALLVGKCTDVVGKATLLVAGGTCRVVIFETRVRLEVIICGVEGWDGQPAPVQAVV